MSMRVFALLAAVLAISAQPAAAQLEICNKTPAPYSLAIAYETDSDVVSQGWWTVDPDKCQVVIPTELNQPYYYHYAISRALNVEWAGSSNFCTSDDPQFRINGGGNCEQRNAHTKGFRQIDVGANKRYTLDISMGPVAASAPPPVAPPPAANQPIEAAPATK